MKRFIISQGRHGRRVAPVLGLLFAIASIASAGCIGQTSSGEATDQASLASSHEKAQEATSDGANNRGLYATPARSLELKTDVHPNDDGQGPHPEPWLDHQGPHPEPWESKMVVGPEQDWNSTKSKP